MKNEKGIFTILEVEYKSTSYYGNPSYYVYMTDEEGEFYKAQTASNSSCAYGIRNFKKEKVEVIYHYTQKSTMIINYVKAIEK